MIPEHIQHRIDTARKVCVFTGAGVSAESGIPTFRDSGGLWENYKLEDLVTPEAFARDPVAVWRWHAWLQGLSYSAQPNPAHKVIAAIDAVYPEFLLITQNIDDLHERAGTKRMVKLHGDIMEILCLDRGHLVRVDVPVDSESIVDRESLPRCPQCGGEARPNVVWFGEMLPVEPLYKAHDFSGDCDLFIIVGTSGAVSGGYGFTESAKYAGALIIEVNPEESALSHLADISIRLPAAEVMSQIFHNYLNL
ncbi:MAG: SIR2 family NAD-dependent protein deacylase [Armatimonadota bacterium]